MTRVPVYEVVYAEGDDFYPSGWLVKFSDRYTGDVIDSFSTKSEAVKFARKRAKSYADEYGFARLLIRKKNDEVSEETDYP